MSQLTESTVLAHLGARGVLEQDQRARVCTLSGGVSGVTFLVETEHQRYVVKQPLAFLAVSDEWPARQERAGVEAAALTTLGQITPAALPRLIDYDPDSYVLIMAGARPGCRDWRAALLDADVDADVGHRLGEVLGIWHARTRTASTLREVFGDRSGFLELRGDPFHRTVSKRCPDLAEPVEACLAELLGPASCLVHGDFSPKNVLVAADGARAGLWVLDFEVAHLGNPVFDVAFMLHHLVLKTIHVPQAAAAVRACAEQFVTAYAEAGGIATDEPAVLRHTGALLLARVHGKSPASYLTPDEARTASDLGARAVTGQLAGWDELWSR